MPCIVIICFIFQLEVPLLFISLIQLSNLGIFTRVCCQIDHRAQCHERCLCPHFPWNLNPRKSDDRFHGHYDDRIRFRSCRARQNHLSRRRTQVVPYLNRTSRRCDHCRTYSLHERMFYWQLTNIFPDIGLQ